MTKTPSDFILELKILFVLLSQAWNDWRDNVHGKLDTHICCSGRECGCEGQLVRDGWKL